MNQSKLTTGVSELADKHSEVVYVVTVRWMDNPHPDVLGVFDNEQAADELMKKCRDWPREWDGLGPVAWEKREREIHSEFNPEALDV